MRSDARGGGACGVYIRRRRTVHGEHVVVSCVCGGDTHARGSAQFHRHLSVVSCFALPGAPSELLRPLTPEATVGTWPRRGATGLVPQATPLTTTQASAPDWPGERRRCAEVAETSRSEDQPDSAATGREHVLRLLARDDHEVEDALSFSQHLDHLEIRQSRDPVDGKDNVAGDQAPNLPQGTSRHQRGAGGRTGAERCVRRRAPQPCFLGRPS